MKRILSIALLVVLSFMLIGCIEIDDIISVEFNEYPKTTYVVGEKLEYFTVLVETADGTEELNSYDQRLTKVGWDTSSPGTRTLTITVDELPGASINFVYTVVNSVNDLLFDSGNGDDEPYVITNAQQLNNIRFALDKNFILANDIDLTGIDWDPIGRIQVTILGLTMVTTVIEGFTGSLDGQEHSIINLTSNEDSVQTLNSVALFSAISDSGEVKNLIFDSPNMNVSWSACALTELLDNATVENVHVTNGYFEGRTAAGLFGQIKGSSVIKNVTVQAEIVIKMVYASSFDYRVAGGIVSQTTISNGNTTEFEGVQFSGSIVHRWSNPDEDELYNAQGTRAGLIIGRNQSYGVIKFIDCTVNGTIIGNSRGYDFTPPNIYSFSFYGYTYDLTGNVTSGPEAHGSLQDVWNDLTEDDQYYRLFSGTSEYDADGDLHGSIEIWEDGDKIYEIDNMG